MRARDNQQTLGCTFESCWTFSSPRLSVPEGNRAGNQNILPKLENKRSGPREAVALTSFTQHLRLRKVACTLLGKRTSTSQLGDQPPQRRRPTTSCVLEAPGVREFAQGTAQETASR